MRIAIFSECYTPVTNGVVTSILTLREALIARGHRVYVFAPGTPQPDDDADIFRLPELPFPRHPYHFARPFPRLNINFASLGVQIVHCQHPFTIGRLGAETARKHGLPMVYTAHSLYDTMAACAKSPLVRTMGPQAMRGVMRRFCAKADYVIAPSQYTRDALRADKVKARYVVIPSGVSRPVTHSGAREQLRAQLGIAPDTPILLCVGRLGPEKRIDILLESIARLREQGGAAPEFHLVLVGAGMCEEDLQAQAEELRLHGRVTFAGTVPHSEIGAWYAAADLFVLPSPCETQGLVIVEAMAAGLPCVAVDEGGPRELVMQGETGLRVPLDVDALTHALDFLLKNPDVRRRFGQNGLEFAAQFTPDAMAQRVLAVYNRAIRLPHPPNETGVRKLTTEIKRRTENTQAKLKQARLKSVRRPRRRV